MTTKPVIQEVTPQQVKSIETLKNKQLHIVEDYDSKTPITSVLAEYSDLINKFLTDNKVKCYTITLTTYRTGEAGALSNAPKHCRLRDNKVEPDKILILIK